MSQRHNREQTSESLGVLLQTFEELQAAKSEGLLEPAFVLTTPEDFLVLNVGPNRPWIAHEEEIVGVLGRGRRIDEAVMVLMEDYIKAALFNGATEGEVGAFLLRHFGEIVKVEYR